MHMSSFFPFRHKILMILFLTTTLPTIIWSNTAWISGSGIDTDDCPFDSPCATFNYASFKAYNQNSSTTNNGEVFVIGPALYNSELITQLNEGKSQTWDGGEGNLATIVGQGIRIATGERGSGRAYLSTDTIILRNLTMIGNNYNGAAIQVGSYFNGATLIIENCKIYGYAPATNTGVINCQGSSSSINLIIKDTIIESNKGDAIIINSIGNVSLSRLTIKHNSGNALNVTKGAIVDISNSVITQNSETAILCVVSGATVNCVSNIITSNGTAFGVESSGLIRISNNDIYNNGDFIDYLDESGQVLTANDNRVGSNGSSPESPTGSIVLQ